ncbi:MAG: cytochrome c oxidase assembly protein [Vulcanimicrobiota bacterium]
MNLELHWHPEPGVLDGIVVLSFLYLLAAGPLRKYLDESQPFPKRQTLWFFSGVVVLFLAVGSPLEKLSEEYLFSAHMFQHVLLIYLVPALFLKGLPAWMMRPLLAMEWSGPLFRFFTRPVVAWLVFNGLFYLWHVPGLYEWALRDPSIHFLEHATFMGAAMLVWWPTLSPTEELPRLDYGPQLLYVLAIGLAQTPLFAFLTFSSTVFYPTYAQAARITSLTPIEDQVLGGVIMKLAAMVATFYAVAFIFYRWYEKSR